MNKIEAARRAVVTSLFEATSFREAYLNTWKPQIQAILGGKPTVSKVDTLGESLRDIFRSNGVLGRGQESLSGGGAAWERLVCYYLNLYLVGSNAIAFSKRSDVPIGVNKALTVSYNNVKANTESDIVVVTVHTPGVLSQSSDNSDDEALLEFGSYVTELLELPSSVGAVSIGVVQCKTNWNDNAQIPMAWDIIYQGLGVSNGAIVLGQGPFSIRSQAVNRFSYSFVTVPTNKLELYKPTSLSVMRVNQLSGGNYWGLGGRSGVASALHSIFRRARIGDDDGRGVAQNLGRSLASFPSGFESFDLV